MARVGDSQASLLVIAVFSRHDTAREQARSELEKEFGAVGLEGPTYPFRHTEYYAAEMGGPLVKQLLAFGRLVDGAELASIKVRTNRMERRIAEAGVYAEGRPVNIDPGLLTLGKFLLATTKDQSHRIYLRDGIFAEVTLRFQDGEFRPWPWTYADYREPVVIEFLGRARDYYRERLRVEAGRV